MSEPARVARGLANPEDIDAAFSLMLAGLLTACPVAVPQGE